MTQHSDWHISSHSGSNDDCVEVKVADPNHPGTVRARDSKDTNIPEMRVRAATWSTFIDHVSHPEV
ncbi:DUF397 domain-containing protein [Streptomyces sp. NPDC091292]|uniref:DUF397 domain-containing protein n=1 Tax=Streptomyces sp. NPDC091292 TaxID=3365991 RepID=UPI0037FDCA75